MFKKEGRLSKIIGIALLVIIIVVVIVLKNNHSFNAEPIYGAIGGGKEDLLGDEEINEIFAKKYGFELVQDSWSNGKTITTPIEKDDGSDYDLVFFSDQRFYDKYKTSAVGTEPPRKSYVGGEIILNTPIVLYSWTEVVDALIKEGIVTVRNNVYYVSNMEKLINYILEGKKWTDIGLNYYGSINIRSVDPVTSSPGATYYGLLLSIMAGGTVTDNNIEAALPKLKTFYEKSQYMNNTPADLFSQYLKTGPGNLPLIVDYEKSIIDFANANPDEWNGLKERVKVLYPTPTIWNSHCILAFSENGKKLIDGLKDKDVSQIAWQRYGFRVGLTGGTYDVTKIGIPGIPKEIESVTSGLSYDYYNRVIDYLKN